MDNPANRQSHSDSATTPVSSVPDKCADLICKLFEQCPDRATLDTWIDMVEMSRSAAAPADARDSQAVVAKGSSHGGEESPTVSNVGGRARYSCHKCDKRLTTRKGFRRHMKEKCEQLRSWVCPICAEDYKRKDRLKKHLRKHQHDSDCACIDKAEALFPLKTALGCGYCIQWFDSCCDKIEHVADHCERLTNLRWSETTRINSLLDHPRIKPAWKRICEAQLCNPSALSWPLPNESVKTQVDCLEYQGSMMDETLKLCLERLLQHASKDEALRGFQPDYALSMYVEPSDMDEEYMMQFTDSENGRHHPNSASNDTIDYHLEGTIQSTDSRVDAMWTSNTSSTEITVHDEHGLHLDQVDHRMNSMPSHTFGVEPYYSISSVHDFDSGPFEQIVTQEPLSGQNFEFMVTISQQSPELTHTNVTFIGDPMSASRTDLTLTADDGPGTGSSSGQSSHFHHRWPRHWHR